MSIRVGDTPALQLLHRFELQLSRGTVEVGRAGARLLAYLALRGMPAGRSHVAGTLWPDSDDIRAMGSVRSALWRVRREAPGVLVSDRGEIALAQEVAIDVGRLSAFSRRAPWSSAPEREELDVLARAVRGELLPGWDDDWLLPERERIRQVRLHAAEHLVGMLSGAGRHLDAVELGRWLTLEAPFRETAHATLARALVAAGHTVEAHAHVRHWTERFRREVGIAESPALRAAVTGPTEPRDHRDLSSN